MTIVKQNAVPLTLPSLSKPRIESIDLLKGVVMVIMALDHVRDYFHYSAFFFSPNDPTQSTLPIFFTRWITNFCAPAFSFLAGLSAFMVGKRKSHAELSAFLLKRGLWLVLIEITLVNFAWKFDPLERHISLQVIWALGVSMIVLAGLIHLPKSAILIISCIIIFGHNLLDTVHFEGSYLWAILHERTRFDWAPGYRFLTGYPLIPWIAVMSLGYCFGSLYDSSFDPIRRRKILNGLGLGCIGLLILLTAINRYGDPLPWKNYGVFSMTLMSVLNVNKYPPSLLYLLTTLGATILFLANAEQLKGKVVRFFCVFGRVPFFYYILHLYLIHFIALFFAEFTGFGWQLMILQDGVNRVQALKGYGLNLAWVYIIWIGVIAALYPVCRKFDTYKQSHKQKWWLSYL